MIYHPQSQGLLPPPMLCGVFNSDKEFVGSGYSEASADQEFGHKGVDSWMTVNGIEEFHQNRKNFRSQIRTTILFP